MKNDAPVDFGPKPNLTDKQVIEAFIRGGGLDHERILREEAQSDGSGEPHRIETSEREQWELRTLTKAFAQSVFTKPNGIPLFLVPALVARGDSNSRRWVSSWFSGLLEGSDLGRSVLPVLLLNGVLFVRIALELIRCM